ncbi:MAG: HAD family hydrolase [Alphaproteobacteria bacterium]|nr:HAD family hydrolase [Alphaproteobacteria bacterium]
MVGRYYKVSDYIKDISYISPDDPDFPSRRTVEDFFTFAGTSEKAIKAAAENKPAISRPEIKLVLLDWDGTVGESYNELGKSLRTLISYLAETRKLTLSEVTDILDFECKRREHFGFEDFFSAYGIQRVLSSPMLARKELIAQDEAFMQTDMEADLLRLYQSFYPSVRTFLQQMQEAGNEVFIFTDTPISEQIDKMIAAGVIAFRDTKDGEKELSYCLIGGLSAREDIHDRPFKEAEVNAMQKAGKIVVSNHHVKPHTEAMEKITEALHRQGRDIKPENILVIGDSLNRDALFALSCKTKFLFVCFPSWHTTFSISMDFSQDYQEAFNPDIFRKLRDTPKSPLEEPHQSLFENYHHEMAIFAYDCLQNLYNFQPMEKTQPKK